jgi:hypothetical protein
VRALRCLTTVNPSRPAIGKSANVNVPSSEQARIQQVTCGHPREIGEQPRQPVGDPTSADTLRDAQEEWYWPRNRMKFARGEFVGVHINPSPAPLLMVDL